MIGELHCVPLCVIEINFPWVGGAGDYLLAE